MRNALSLLALLIIAAMFTSGCAGPEEKFGRGMRNASEIVRMGEMRRSIEQTAVWDSPDDGYTTGFIRGLNHSLARTGLGIFEIATAPIPPYHPIFTSYLTPEPAYPASYKPGIISDPLFQTDTYFGFSGGDVAPAIPGSRFSVFDN
jgi:putative exosortase-associated protein (TIGR04073 family)